MTKPYKMAQRMTYLLAAKWEPVFDLELPDFRQVIRGWRREIDGVGAVYSFLGAFMRQQAADARAEREAEGR